MKLSVAKIILFASIPASFAGNFTSISKMKIVQTACSTNCQTAFALCVRLRGTGAPPPTLGTQQVAPTAPPLVVGANCELDQAACLRACATNPRG